MTPAGAISYRCIFTTRNPKKCRERQEWALPQRGERLRIHGEGGEERPPFLSGDQRAEPSPGPG